jgi:CHRD domain
MNLRLLMVSLFTLLAVACGGSTAAKSAVSSPSSTPAAAAIRIPLHAENGSSANGMAYITVQDGHFTVRLNVAGLHADSPHPAHIHVGTCGSNGAIIYPLQNVIANGSGNGTSTTTITHPFQAPANGRYINVHLGPTMAGSGAMPIACGQIPR